MPSGVYDRKRGTLEERWWASVAVCEHGRDCTVCCWKWMGGVQRSGYGQIYAPTDIPGKGRALLAHRVGYALNVGPIPEGYRLYQTCDLLGCCNWNHAKLGSTPDKPRGPHYVHTTIPLEERFWKHLQVCEHGRECESCCWLWTGSKNSAGYGQLHDVHPVTGRKTMVLAHRVSYAIAYGPLKEGELGLHTCDVPLCCNWHHVYAGDYKDNEEDKYSRGRALIGEQHHNAKLTVALVQEIRSLAAQGMRQMDIAIQCGLSQRAVSDVILGKTWKHVSGAIPRIGTQVGEPDTRQDLTQEEIQDIRERYATGMVSEERLRVLYGISRRLIRRVLA